MLFVLEFVALWAFLIYYCVQIYDYMLIRLVSSQEELTKLSRSYQILPCLIQLGVIVCRTHKIIFPVRIVRNFLDFSSKKYVFKNKVKGQGACSID